MTWGYIESGGEPPELEMAKVGPHILSGYFGEDRERMRLYLADLLEREFMESGMEAPAWISRLREEPWEGSERM
jgi:hypothetical protein